MQDYGKNDEEQRRYLYPDSDYPNSLPSVTPLVGPRRSVVGTGGPTRGLCRAAGSIAGVWR